MALGFKRGSKRVLSKFYVILNGYLQAGTYTNAYRTSANVFSYADSNFGCTGHHADGNSHVGAVVTFHTKGLKWLNLSGNSYTDGGTTGTRAPFEVLDANTGVKLYQSNYGASSYRCDVSGHEYLTVRYITSAWDGDFTPWMGATITMICLSSE